MELEMQNPKTLEELSNILPDFRFILFSDLEENKDCKYHSWYVNYVLDKNYQYGCCYVSWNGASYDMLSQPEFEKHVVQTVFKTIKETMQGIKKQGGHVLREEYLKNRVQAE